ncbi:hypothetical protein D3C76_708600 [compost metagenome]
MCVIRRLPQQIPRRPVEQHGVATGNALHKSVLEARWFAEQGGVTNRDAMLINQLGARAEQRGHFSGYRAHPVDANFESFRGPEVVLVAEGKIGRLDLAASQKA